MTVNLNKNREMMVAAWKDVVDDKSRTDWALFGYEGQSNDLQFVSKGDGGLEELKEELNSGKIMYAFMRVQDPNSSLTKYVLINWQGEGAPQVRKGTCANHIRDIRNLLSGAHITINARNEEEVEEDVIMDKVKSTGSGYSFKERIGDVDRQTTPVGTVYKRVIPKNEINTVERDKFWQKEEEEEKKRLAEERRRKEEIKIAEKERQEKEAEQMLADRESPEKIVKRRESIREEAQQLIKMRNFDARAVFERNTSVGQLNSRRSSRDTPLSPGAETASRIQTVWPPQEQKESSRLVSQPVSAYKVIEKKEEEKLFVKNEALQATEEIQKESQTEHSVTSRVEVEHNNYLNGSETGNDYEDLGIRAEALYDYQAADETEISFDPGDIITHIDQIDAGWWQGLGPDGTFGLFPANYVELL